MPGSMFNKFALDANMIMAFLKDANVVGASVDPLTNVVTLHVDEDSPDVMFDLTPLLVDFVEKQDGMGLSHNDFTDALKQRLEEIQDQEQADWAEANVNHVSYIKNKPNLYLPDQVTRDILGDLGVDSKGHLLFRGKPTDAVQPDWAETDTQSHAYIKHKPAIHHHENSEVLDALSSNSDGELLYQGHLISGVQSDWEQTIVTAPDYIKNKPVLFDPPNKAVLKELTEDANGELNYRGVRVNTEYQPDWEQRDHTKPDYIRNKPTLHIHDNLYVVSRFDEGDNDELYWAGHKIAFEANMITGIKDEDEYGIPTEFYITTA